MPTLFRNYTKIAGITDDYFKVRSFLLNLGYSEFVYARWDWMATHGYLDKTAVGKIGLWEAEDEIVGVATFDTRLGIGYCLTHPDYRELKEEMLKYAEDHLSTPDGFEVVMRWCRKSGHELRGKMAILSRTGVQNGKQTKKTIHRRI